MVSPYFLVSPYFPLISPISAFRCPVFPWHQPLSRYLVLSLLDKATMRIYYANTNVGNNFVGKTDEVKIYEKSIWQLGYW